MRRSAATLLICTLLSACQGMPDKPIPTVAKVDLQRFMGDWYVIANIPTFIETGAYNAVETYALLDATTIKTTFKFNQDNFNGPLKVYNPTGYVVDTKTNAHWDMQFLWPFKSEYRIVFLDENYQHTIIGRSKRDYLWIMSRSPDMSQAIYQQLVKRAVQLGYDEKKIKPVPQKWHN